MTKRVVVQVQWRVAWTSTVEDIEHQRVYSLQPHAVDQLKWLTLTKMAKDIRWQREEIAVLELPDFVVQATTPPKKEAKCPDTSSVEPTTPTNTTPPPLKRRRGPKRPK